jgi:hypothetical protein
MSIIRFTAEVLPDGTIQLPAGIHLAPGRAEVTVVPAGKSNELSSLRDFAGAIRSGDPQSADNSRIDADLANSFGDSHPEAE